MIVLFAILVVIAIVLGTFLLLKSRNGPSAPVTRSNSAQERLSEIESLRRKNLITEAEYQAKRQTIVDSL